jgi:hypothetical protein
LVTAGTVARWLRNDLFGQRRRFIGLQGMIGMNAEKPSPPIALKTLWGAAAMPFGIGQIARLPVRLLSHSQSYPLCLEPQLKGY